MPTSSCIFIYSFFFKFFFRICFLTRSLCASSELQVAMDGFVNLSPVTHPWQLEVCSQVPKCSATLMTNYLKSLPRIILQSAGPPLFFHFYRLSWIKYGSFYYFLIRNWVFRHLRRDFKDFFPGEEPIRSLIILSDTLYYKFKTIICLFKGLETLQVFRPKLE